MYLDLWMFYPWSSRFFLLNEKMAAPSFSFLNKQVVFPSEVHLLCDCTIFWMIELI